MSAEENVSLARRFFAEQDRRKGPPPEELCAPDYTAHVPGFPTMDLTAHADLGRVFYAAFPDITQTIDDAVGEEEKAALRFTITGTHQGELMGIPPSGKRIEIPAIAIFHIAGGKVTALYEIFDQMGMMQQIGAIPSQ